MLGISLAAQRLRLHSSNAGSTGSIPGWGTKVLHAAEHIQNVKKKKKKLSQKNLTPILCPSEVHTTVTSSRLTLGRP